MTCEKNRTRGPSRLECKKKKNMTRARNVVSFFGILVRQESLEDHLRKFRRRLKHPVWGWDIGALWGRLSIREHTAQLAWETLCLLASQPNQKIYPHDKRLYFL